MKPLPADVPRWPLWMVPTAVAGAWLAALVAAIVVASGDGRLGPGGVLIFSAIASLGVAAVVAGLASTTARVERRHLGLRPTEPRATVLALGLAAAAVGIALAVAVVAGDPFAHPTIPDELSTAPPLQAGPDLSHVPVGASALASILARAVIAALAAELVLRGFLLPILAGRLGLGGATVLLGIAFGAAAAPEPGLVVPTAVLGAVLCVLYSELGSIVPGIGLCAAAFAGAIAAGMDWLWWECAAVALAAGLTAYLPAALVARGVPGVPPAGGSPVTPAG